MDMKSSVLFPVTSPETLNLNLYGRTLKTQHLDNSLNLCLKKKTEQ